MAGTRSARATRAAAVLAVFAAVIALSAAGVPGGASDDPASVAEAAPAAGPSPTPSADPLAAPVGPGQAGDSAPAGSPTQPAPTATPAPAPAAAPAPSALAAAGSRARKITDATGEWASFTLLDRRTGTRTGDARSAEVTNTESTVKVWLAADLLATRAAEGRSPTPYEMTRMTSMIRLSDDNSAAVIWRWMGSDASIRKMIATCRLTDTRVYPEWWSLTQISARDLAKLGSCLVPGPGRFLSPKVGAPLIALMRSVDPSNAFGIQQAYPAGKEVRIAVKNGWTEHGGTGLWNVNCLGIWGPGLRWTLAVTVRYPIADGLEYGAAVCRRVTAATFPLTQQR